jgi:predicted component of type VI protein secretion system
MRTKEQEINKVNFIKSLTKDNYFCRHSYYRIDEVQEAVRINYLLSTKDMLLPVKVKGIDLIFFKSDSIGIIADFACVKNENKYELYEMNMNTYNEYERYMSDLM